MGGGIRSCDICDPYITILELTAAGEESQRESVPVTLKLSWPEIEMVCKFVNEFICMSLEQWLVLLVTMIVWLFFLFVFHFLESQWQRSTATIHYIVNVCVSVCMFLHSVSALTFIVLGVSALVAVGLCSGDGDIYYSLKLDFFPLEQYCIYIQSRLAINLCSVKLVKILITRKLKMIPTWSLH